MVLQSQRHIDMIQQISRRLQIETIRRAQHSSEARRASYFSQPEVQAPERDAGALERSTAVAHGLQQAGLPEAHIECNMDLQSSASLSRPKDLD